MKALPTQVDDELAFLASLVPLEGANVVEVGCGAADFARKLVASYAHAHVTGVEIDERQHAKNLAQETPHLRFVLGGGQQLPLPSEKFGVGLMLKSLHHVPHDSMDRALQEMARVLEPHGVLYVSEPVFEGPFNEIVRLFHDEQVVRAQAQAALDRAAAAPEWEQVVDHRFMTPLFFLDFESFERRIIAATYQDHRLAPDLLALVRQRFEAHMTPDGARFVRPMRVRLLRKTAVG
ncbi:class I SAM-dependent methyltransferase [Variovorax sp. GB1P17]|uniref:class I SAM-dependent methyltransferase n=1 Tax=Variovorax sp. GB1P17 TaxID=3443740 RepID=UPI003F46AEF9